MTKREALESFLPLKKAEGYLTHPTLLLIYEDSDELPESVVEMLWYTPPPQDITLYGSQELFDAIDEMIRQEYKIKK